MGLQEISEELKQRILACQSTKELNELLSVYQSISGFDKETIEHMRLIQVKENEELGLSNICYEVERKTTEVN